MAVNLLSRYRGCLLGLAVGDAMGAPFEFANRDAIREVLSEMQEGGPFGLKMGQWTDDTAMALCLADSLLEKKGFDLRDQIERYCRWYKEGYMSSTGSCFDIGVTTRRALDRYLLEGNPQAGSRDPQTAGNGSIMRLAPVPLFYHRKQEEAIEKSGISSITTHGAAECVDGCRLLAAAIVKALDGASKEDLFLFDPGIVESPRIADIAQGNYLDKKAADISGSGYVVNSLEAAFWCFHTTDSYEEAILAAIRLGDDTDTTAAVCGQLAGTFYGEEAIPKRWLDPLAKRDLVIHYAEALYHCAEDRQ